ncbi:hypothetical protein GH818_01325 [Bacillus thuringiensis]|nr:hypothetical protein DN397_17475 [Bacillus sp. AY1-10]KAB7633660.1 hypothetical protein GBN96_23110 [Bacillus sp. B4-WWTP-NA-D-NA-NA]MDR4139881.1 hypothetical protein [Bacillus paranthracis]MRA58914.1 hypothetical protein [Bacillus thuringiensis]MDR4276065.1 hypothetical protein [Bacillus paranthracis]
MHFHFSSRGTKQIRFCSICQTI